MRFFVMIAAFALTACESLALTPTNVSGQWGGPHVGLTLEGGLGTIEYDCATGTIDEPILPGRGEGSFTAKGTYRAGQGGPVRVGQIFRASRATYSGTVVKDDMTLNVRLEDGTALGPFTLRRGAAPQIVRCL